MSARPVPPTRAEEERIRISWQADLQQLTVECDQGRTITQALGPPITTGPPIFDRHMLAGPLGLAVLLQHYLRCSACQRYLRWS